MYHVIEHLDDPFICVKLIYKKLKKNGELIIGTPNVGNIMSRLFRKYWYNLDSPRHLYLFTPKTLQKTVMEENYTIKSIEYCFVGGLIGSIQYLLSEIMRRKINLVHRQWLVVLLYPIERVIDLFGVGDIFVLRAVKR